MDISRELAIEILRYCSGNKNFHFPFLVVCRGYDLEFSSDSFSEVEPDEWGLVKKNQKYNTFQLWENLNDLREDTLFFMAKGFIEKITNQSLERKLCELAKEYRSSWKEELWESESIEEFGLNEFLGGKADAFEEILHLMKKSQGYDLKTKKEA